MARLPDEAPQGDADAQPAESAEGANKLVYAQTPTSDDREQPALLNREGPGRFRISEELALRPAIETRRRPTEEAPPRSDAGAAVQQRTTTYTDQSQADQLMIALAAAIEGRADSWRRMTSEQRSDQREAFERWATEACGAMEWYTSLEEHDATIRRQVVDSYFRLERLLRAKQGRSTVTERVTGRSPIKPTEVVDPAKFRPVWFWAKGRITKRRVLLALALGVLVWRCWALVRGPALDTTVPASDDLNLGDAVVGVDARGMSPAVFMDLQRGVPVITSVRVYQREDGALHAQGHAMDTGASPPTLTYTWHRRGGVLLQEGESDVLPAGDVTTGESYTVTVVAKNGGRHSRPVTTRPLVITRSAAPRH